MFAFAKLQLDHVVGNGGQPSFGDLLAVADAVPDISAPAHEAAVLVEVAQRTFGARRGGFELIAGGEGISLVEECTQRFADPLAVVEGHTLVPVDANPQRGVPARPGE